MDGEQLYTADELYANGFNDSYELNEVDPELTHVITDALPADKGSYEQGWVDGVQQLEHDRLSDKAQELEDLRNKGEQGKGLDR